MQKTRTAALATLLITTAFGGCFCDEPLQVLAPKIEIGDPYDPLFSVCETDFVHDCAYGFGDVDIGPPKFFSFVIKNPSSADLHIYDLSFAEGSAPQFTFEGELPDTIENEIGGTGKIVTVKYVAELESTQNAQIIIDSDAKNLLEDEKVTIDLSATGFDRCNPEVVVSPPECDFGAVGIGSTAFCDISVSNDGACELQITGARFSEGTPTPTVFGNQSPLIVPTFIQQGTATSIRLYARPQATSVATGGLILDTNDVDHPSVQIPLSVQGAQAPTAIARVKSINGTANSSPSPAVEPLDNVVVSGDESTGGSAGATVTGWQWELIEKPAESSVTLTAPAAVDTGFRFSSAAGIVQGLDVAGTFVVRLTVTDSTGAVSSNDARVTLNAVPTEGLHVQLSWSAAVDDIDLHLGQGTSPDWCSTQDCYYGNCTYSPPNWDSAAGFTDGDPKLDIDDLTGYGPENINIESPVAGTYVVGVHAFSGNGSTGGFTPTDVTIKIFLGGALADEFYGHLQNDDDYWTVARVDVAASGAATVSSIDSMQTSWSCY